MVTNKTKLYALCAMSLLCSLESAASTVEDNFQVAVVDSAPGTSDIVAGRYQQGIQTIGKINESNSDMYEMSLGVCTASLMESKLEEAEQACSSAISVHKEKKTRKHRYLTSIAYSNRGIVKYKKGNFEGAFADFSAAKSLHNNRLVKKNLSTLELSMAKKVMATFSMVLK